MTYIPPSGHAVGASWQTATPYSPPGGASADATWASGTIAGYLAAASPLGAPALCGIATETIEGLIAAPGPLSSPALLAAQLISARLALPSVLGAPAVLGGLPVVGRVAVPSPLAVPRLVGVVVRYELRGEVRDQGVLVNRRVRAYNRASGALIAEADTDTGLFALPVGFTADEYYLVPINIDAAATDFAPPCANRVTSVLAMDPV